MSIYGIDITKEFQSHCPVVDLRCTVYRDNNKRTVTFVVPNWCVITVKINTGYTLTYHRGSCMTARLNGVFIADFGWARILETQGQEQLSEALFNLLN